MNNTEVKLHYYQKAIVKKLITNQGLRFKELLIEGLESEHMNYHLQKLIDLGFINKNNIYYDLTDTGKDYSNLLDDQSEIVEKQPKTSIIIWGIRKNQETKQIEHLVNKRLRQPYFGKVGRLTGKVRFGEKLEEAAARELFEETGMKAGKFTLEKVYHKIRRREDGFTVQDVVFYIFFTTNFTGTMIERTPFQHNFWISQEEIVKRNDLDLYDDFEIDKRMRPYSQIKYVENVGTAEGY